MPSKRNKCMNVIKQNILLLLILLGVVCGIIVGFAIRPLHASADVKMWLGLPGSLYLRSLKMMIVPLIVSSVITGTATLDPRANGKISIVAFTYIFLTNIVGAILGILAFVLFKPGKGGVFKDPLATKTTTALETQDIFADLLRNIITDNLFEATFIQTQTKYARKEIAVNGSTYITFVIEKELGKVGGANLLDNLFEATFIQTQTKYARKEIAVNGSTNITFVIEKELGKGGGANLLGLIFVSTFVGIAISSLKENGRPLYLFFNAATKAVILIIQWFLWLTPLGVFSLILVPIAGIKDVGILFGELGMFSAAIIIFIFVQQSLVLPLILFLLTRRNPYYHLLLVSRAWLISFATSSVAVTIPDMLDVCEKKLGVDPRVSRFTIPFGVTLSANGSALFIVCSCLFSSNLVGVPPTTTTIFIVGIITSVSTLAIPSVPSASIVTILMILTSLDISTEPIALVLTVEFLLDRLRSTSSLVSDTMCAVVTHHFCRHLLSDTGVQDDHLADIDVDAIGDWKEHEKIPMTLQYKKECVDHV